MTVRDGAVRHTSEAPAAAEGLAVDRGGRYAYLAYDREENGAAVATVDLGTGEVVADVVLCDEIGSAADVALAADGSALAASAACPGEDAEDPLYLLV